MIDYVFVNEKGYERVKAFTIGERVDSDHLPLMVTLDTEEERIGTWKKRIAAWGKRRWLSAGMRRQYRNLREKRKSYAGIKRRNSKIRSRELCTVRWSKS